MEDSTNSGKNDKISPVPYGLIICGAARRLIGASYRDFATKPEVTAESYLSVIKKFGGSVLAWTDLSIEAADFGQKMIYPEESTPHPDYKNPLIKDVEDYKKLKRIDIKEAKRMQATLKTIRLVLDNDNITGDAISCLCMGPLGVLNMMRGSERLFRDCVLYTSEVITCL